MTFTLALMLAAVTGNALIAILVLALVLVIVYFIVAYFFQGPPLKIVGLILGLIFLIYALNRLGLFNF